MAKQTTKIQKPAPVVSSIPEAFTIVEFKTPEVEVPVTVDNSASSFFTFKKIVSFFKQCAVKIKRIHTKSTDTFVNAVYREFIEGTLTEARYIEIANAYNTATHRFKAYVAYFKAGKYVLV